MSKSVYVLVVHDLELLRYVLRCAIGRHLSFPTGINKVYCCCCCCCFYRLLSGLVSSAVWTVPPWANKSVLRAAQHLTTAIIATMVAQRPPPPPSPPSPPFLHPLSLLQCSLLTTCVSTMAPPLGSSKSRMSFSDQRRRAFFLRGLFFLTLYLR